MELRLIVYGLWALGTLLVWGSVVIDDWRSYRSDGEHRNVLPDLFSDFALFICAVAAAISLVVLIVDLSILGVRGFAIAVFLGSFLGAGLIKRTLRRRMVR